jgi:hypothetical protein
MWVAYAGGKLDYDDWVAVGFTRRVPELRPPDGKSHLIERSRIGEGRKVPGQPGGVVADGKMMGHSASGKLGCASMSRWRLHRSGGCGRRDKRSAGAVGGTAAAFMLGEEVDRPEAVRLTSSVLYYERVTTNRAVAQPG